MKRLIHLVLMPGISLAILLTSTMTVEAQGPPPPPSGETNETGHGFTENRPPSDGGSAPLGSGLVLMLGMGVAYGACKYKQSTKTGL